MMGGTTMDEGTRRGRRRMRGWATGAMLAGAALVPVGAPLAAQAGGTGAAVAIAPVTLPPEVDRVLREYERAWRATDAAALAALFTEDGFILRPGRSAVRGRDAIRAAYTGVGGPLHLIAWDWATSGDTGWIIGGFALAEGGPAVGKYTLTLRRSESGRWLIHSDMDNGGGA